MTILRSEIRNKYSNIPNSVIQNKELSDGDFRLLIYLYSLPDGWKVNQEYLGVQLGCNRRNINAKIKRIKEAGYLDIIRENSKESDIDYVYLLKEKNGSVNNVSVNDSELVNDASVNDSYINTYIINNKKENIKRKKETDQNLIINEILDYYNNCYEYNQDQFQKKKAFRVTSKNKQAVKLIKQRLNEDYTINDFKDVIFFKYLDFIEHEQSFNGKSSIYYYRPETLFNSENFAKYKQEYDVYCNDT